MKYLKQPKWRIALDVVALLLIIGLANGSARWQHDYQHDEILLKAQQITSSSNDKPSNSVASQPRASTVTQKEPPKVLLDSSGTGSQQTQSFTTSGDWNVVYTYDCSNLGSSGNFIFQVNDSNGSISDDAGANELSPSGGSTDYYHDAGNRYLKILTGCKWHVTVNG